MKHITLLFLLTPILIFSQLTENLSTELPTIQKKLYTKGSFIFGSGSDKVFMETILFEDSSTEDVYIYPGGGIGVEAVIGYDLIQTLSCELAIGIANNGETYNEGDWKLMFKKSFLRVSILYKIPLGKKFTPYIGAGVLANLSVKYDQEAPGYPDINIVYNNPIGFNLLGGAEFKNRQSPWFWFGELRVIMLGEYTIESFKAGGFSVTEYVENSEYDNLNANGFQFSFGVGYYIN